MKSKKELIITEDLRERIKKVSSKFSVLDAAKRCKVPLWVALKYSK